MADVPYQWLPNIYDHPWLREIYNGYEKDQPRLQDIGHGYENFGHVYLVATRL